MAAGDGEGGTLTTDLTFSDEVIVVIPYASFSGTVRIVGSDSTAYTVSECTSSQYTGSTSSASALVLATNYSLDDATAGAIVAGNHCYVYYSDNIYVATRHFSDFVGGVATSSSSSSSGGALVPGGGGGGSRFSSSDDDDDEETFTEEDAPQELDQFSDLEDLPTTDWKYEAILTAVDAGLFSGEMVDGKRVFNMREEMNRAQAAAVVARYYECDDGTPRNDPFVDVDKDTWYGPAVYCLKKNGIVSGKDASTFAPSTTVTRAEFFRMLAGAYMDMNSSIEEEWTGLMETATHPFVDVSSANWYAGYAALAYDQGLLAGYKVGAKTYLKGDQPIIRVEGAAMVTRYLGL